VSLQDAGQRLEQCGLAPTVLPHHGETSAGSEGEFDAVMEDASAPGEAEPAGAQMRRAGSGEGLGGQGHVAPSGGGSPGRRKRRPARSRSAACGRGAAPPSAAGAGAGHHRGPSRGAQHATHGSCRHCARSPEYQGSHSDAAHSVESSAMSTVLSAVAWPYANGPRHYGHVAGFGVPSDVFSRYMRMAGHDVLMISGTDEHGTPILVAADAEGVPARELADRNNRTIVEDLVALGLSYDLFTRTTTRNHYQVVQDMFVAVRDNGYMIEQLTSGAVSPSTGRTLPDRYIEGTCPICNTPGARGDQCDACGNQLDPTDLIDPVSRING